MVGYKVVYMGLIGCRLCGGFGEVRFRGWDLLRYCCGWWWFRGWNLSGMGGVRWDFRGGWGVMGWGVMGLRESFRGSGIPIGYYIEQ